LAALALSYLVHNLSRRGVRAGLCNGTVILSLANRAAHEKKFKRKRKTVSDFFEDCIFPKIKPSPNCLRNLVSVSHREIRVSRIAKKFCFSIGAHRNR
jgi:hypothetical protein